MRQLLSIRLVAALAALAALAFGLNAVLLDDELDVAVASADDAVPRSIDLVDVVLGAERSDDFEVADDGTITGFIDLELPRGRVMRVPPGAIGDLDCTGLQVGGRCAVFAVLLGDAVLWFATRPIVEDGFVALGEVEALIDGEAVLDNGWRIPFPPVIERDCEDLDIVSFSDFLRRFSAGSTSLVDVSTGEVVTVRCAPKVIEAARRDAARTDDDS